MNKQGLVEEMVLAGLGVLSLTREKAEAVVDDWVNVGQVGRDEAKQWVDRLTTRGEDERGALRQMVKDEIAHAISGLDLATGRDVAALDKKIQALESRLDHEPPAA